MRYEVTRVGSGETFDVYDRYFQERVRVFGMAKAGGTYEEVQEIADQMNKEEAKRQKEGV